MKNLLNPKKLMTISIVVTGFLAASFIGALFWNKSAGVATYEEYLNVIKEPYQLLYSNLQALPEHPTEAAVYRIYDQFDRDVHQVKISSHAEKKVEENYKQLIELPETFKEDYDRSAYKYSTLIGQTSHVKMILEYLDGK
ncbi:hypothetical protein BACCIP111895_01207 [Neobacillus rhizosphaerae]|uniref:Uncharacterized protein n=1 Tax=Neobacillus rhizosphaerae TaxID=2880965 RepID=A0ABM9EN53_9BACI|nr:hypothetical protein [Neobacillus rhizosphaerae]CAH2714053.1 hypothetical protein BACCIP111895_01207 [Neobacillus rhizosphaerae]